MVGIDHCTNTRRVTLEYPRFKSLFPLLVLDRWLRELSRRVHLSHVWYFIPNVLHDGCSGDSLDVAHSRDRRVVVQLPLFLRFNLVS